MRTVTVTPPSFPKVQPNTLLTPEKNVRWQVICGDQDHWRMGFYSPDATSASECKELEKHTCPELFMLISGKVSLVLEENGKRRELALEPFKPVLVECLHNGFCPDGPFTGTALVVERDTFQTQYLP